MTEDINSNNKCKTCGKEVKFRNLNLGLKIYCSTSCALKDRDNRQKEIPVIN